MLKTTLICATTVFLLAQSLAGTSLAQQRVRIGRVDALQGSATIQRQGTLAHVTVSVGDNVFERDFIQTSRDSKVRISLTDGTALTMGQQARLRLTRYAFEHDQSGRVILAFLSGALQVVAQWLPSRSFELRTQTAAVGIRGTRFFADAGQDTTGILLTEGRVAVSNIDPRIPGEVTLAPGEGTDVAANLPPTAPGIWGAGRRSTLEQAATLP